MSFKCDQCGEINRYPIKWVVGTRRKHYNFYNKKGTIVKIKKGYENSKEHNICTKCATLNKIPFPKFFQSLNSKEINQYDCNACDVGDSCQGDFVYKGKRKNPKRVKIIGCYFGFKPITPKFSLIEMALQCPISLYEVFKSLPFKAKITDYIKT